MNPTERFSDRADDYRRYRPGYPLAVIDLMCEVCGLRPGMRVVDIGSGTGIFTKLLLQAGLDVTAVEPNDAMRATAGEDLRGYPLFHSVGAPAEQTGLPDAAFDAITVAQAFHWFDLEAVRCEFRRLLKPGGWAFIIRNQRLTNTSRFAEAYEVMLKSFGERYDAVDHRDQETRTRKIGEFFSPEKHSLTVFNNPHVLDWPALRGHFLSTSYAPKEDSSAISRLEQIFHLFNKDGTVTFDQHTEVFYGGLAQAPVV